MPLELLIRHPVQMLLLALWTVSGTATGAPLNPDHGELAAREAAASVIPDARLLWVRDGAVLHTRLRPWAPQRAVVGLDGVLARPRWSPDGTRFLFQRDDQAIYLQSGAGGPARLVLSGAHTADWAPGGNGFTAISLDGHQVLLHDLARGQTRVLLDTREPPLHGQVLAQAAELDPSGRYLLTFRREPRHTTEVIDLGQRRLLSNPQMRRGDCNPAWTPDGRHVLTTARTANRPILLTSFDPSSGALDLSRRLAELGAWSRYALHDPRPSLDGQWLVAAGEVLLGGGMRGRQEIYLWRRGDPPDRMVRLTFDSADDTQPSLFVPPAGKPTQN